MDNLIYLLNSYLKRQDDKSRIGKDNIQIGLNNIILVLIEELKTEDNPERCGFVSKLHICDGCLYQKRCSELVHGLRTLDENECYCPDLLIPFEVLEELNTLGVKIE